MKKRLNHFVFTCIFSALILYSFTASPQQFNFTRTHLFEENVRGFITCIAQDSKGYVWFTGTSLYRYDGYQLLLIKMTRPIRNLFRL